MDEAGASATPAVIRRPSRSVAPRRQRHQHHGCLTQRQPSASGLPQKRQPTARGVRTPTATTSVVRPDFGGIHIGGWCCCVTPL